MADPFLGEIRTFSWNWPPAGWALCDGALLPVNQNTALYTLLGNFFGGSPNVTVGLPDLRGRTPIHAGAATPGLMGGAEAVTLTSATMAAHTHFVQVVNATGNEIASTDPYFLAGASADNEDPPVTPNIYGTAGTATTLNPATLLPVGGGQPHANIQPYLCVNFCVATKGIYPQRP